jgi:hypothetical protein
MQMYKLIFDNNNKETVRAFFNDLLVRKLWLKIFDQLKEDQIFLPASTNELQKKRDLTMHQVTHMLLFEFNLELPAWWVKKYPLIGV